MLVRVAGDAKSAVGVRALASPVFLGAVSALVDIEDAFICEVVPPLAFYAPDWLLFDFLYMCPAVAEGEAVSYGSVGCLGICKRHDEMGGLLAR